MGDALTYGSGSYIAHPVVKAIIVMLVAGSCYLVALIVRTNSINNRKSNLEHIQDFGAINASKSGKEDRYNHEKYYPLIGAISRDHLIMSGVLAWSLDIFTGRIDQKKYQGSNMLESI